MLKYNILTIFPEIFNGFTGTSLIGKAVEKKIIIFNILDIRNFTKEKNRHVDDKPYGGSPGMALMLEPICACLEKLASKTPKSKKRTILLSPSGKPLTQKYLTELSKLREITLICGRYEGIDERIKHYIDDEISLGDYVLMGGEIPAMAVIEGATRLIPGVIKEKGSYTADSFFEGLLDFPVYTRPAVFRGKRVPEILLSGNHSKIDQWQKEQAFRATYIKRPDLIFQKELTEEENRILSILLKKNQRSARLQPRLT